METNDQRVLSLIRRLLVEMSDAGYKEFVAKLVPTVEKKMILGVRTPDLRTYARELYGTAEGMTFLTHIPHALFDENNLHGQILCLCRSFEEAAEKICAFLPMIDNWATCDSIRPKALTKDMRAFSVLCGRWIADDRPFVVRFGLEMRMCYFLDGHFDAGYLREAAGIRSGAYYVQMMVAWFFATALAKQFDQTLSFLSEWRLDPTVHRMMVRKALDSNRLSPEQKKMILAI